MIDERKRLWSIVIGVVLWFIAAQLVHQLDYRLDRTDLSALLFGLLVLSSWLTIDLYRLLLRPAPGELLPMLAWGTAAALLLDGLAVRFVPSLYAGVSSATQFGAAAIMWGAGLGLLFSMLRERRA